MSGKSARRLRRRQSQRRNQGGPPTGAPEQEFDPSLLTEEQKAAGRQKLTAQHRADQLGKSREVLILTKAALEESEAHLKNLTDEGASDEAIERETERVAALKEFTHDVRSFFLDASEFLLATVEMSEATDEPNFPDWLREEPLIAEPDAEAIAVVSATKDSADLPDTAA